MGKNKAPECNCPDRANGLHEERGCRITDPDWSGNCEDCNASPVVPVTGLCGPCTFGEADTAGGNW